MMNLTFQECQGPKPARAYPIAPGSSRVRMSTKAPIVNATMDLPEPSTKTQRRPKTARVCSARKRAPKCPTRAEIEALHRELDAVRPKPIKWRDSASTMQRRFEVKPAERQISEKRVIADIYSPVNPNEVVKAAPLISTTASVADYIGLPVIINSYS